jgi:hypothetical protein
LYAEAVQVSECQFLFPASLEGSSLIIVHSSDEQMSKTHFFHSLSVIKSHGKGFGSNILSAANVPDFVHDGKLTIKAELQIAPATEGVFSLN